MLLMVCSTLSWGSQISQEMVDGRQNPVRNIQALLSCASITAFLFSQSQPANSPTNRQVRGATAKNLDSEGGSSEGSQPVRQTAPTIISCNNYHICSNNYHICVSHKHRPHTAPWMSALLPCVLKATHMRASGRSNGCSTASHYNLHLATARTCALTVPRDPPTSEWNGIPGLRNLVLTSGAHTFARKCGLGTSTTCSV